MNVKMMIYSIVITKLRPLHANKTFKAFYRTIGKCTHFYDVFAPFFTSVKWNLKKINMQLRLWNQCKNI